MRVDLHDLLPWAYPFRMVDRVVECIPHQRAVTYKAVTVGDTVIGHRLADPHFPSALVLEGLSQTAALLFRMTYGPEALTQPPLLGYLKAKLRGCVRPGDKLVYTVIAIKMTSRRGVFTGRASVGDALVATTELAFGVGAP